MLDDSKWANSPGEIERDYEMERHGFVPSVCEPKCMLGRPAPPMTPEMQQDMTKYFQEELWQVALKTIDQMVPIFSSIRLTPESMSIPEYPLPE